MLGALPSITHVINADALLSARLGPSSMPIGNVVHAGVPFGGSYAPIVPSTLRRDPFVRMGWQG